MIACVSDWVYFEYKRTVQSKPPAGDNGILYIGFSILYDLYVMLTWISLRFSVNFSKWLKLVKIYDDK